MLPRFGKFVRRRIVDPHRADDLVAEILRRIHQNIDDQELLPNWMFRISRNAVIDEYRRAGRSREQLAWNLLERSTDALPAEQREALEMVDLAGMTQAEAAQRNGVCCPA